MLEIIRSGLKCVVDKYSSLCFYSSALFCLEICLWCVDTCNMTEFELFDSGCVNCFTICM